MLQNVTSLSALI